MKAVALGGAVRFSGAALLLALSPFLGGMAHAAHPCMGAADSVRGQLAGAAKGGFRLVGNERIFFLHGVTGAEAPPAQSALTLYLQSEQSDRYGQWPVQAFAGDEWVQGKLLRGGDVVLNGAGLPTPCLDLARVAETRGREKRRGIWAEPQMGLRAQRPADMEEHFGRFVVVTGKVMGVGDRKTRLYLNFGKNWSQDFTVSVVKSGRGAFKGGAKGGLSSLAAAKGKTVRVRGVLEQRQGPLIRLVNEAQIEYLD